MAAGVVGARLTVAEAAAAEVAAPAASAQTLAQQIDGLWARRDDPRAMAEQKRLLDKALAESPGEYVWLWRAARWYFWKSDDPNLDDAQKMKLGKLGWDLGERAVAANPKDVAGYFWAAATMGNYALGLGIFKALTQRIESKFRDRLNKAEALDPKYADGSIPVMWARYWATLPWPKYDEKKALANYEKALRLNPAHLRAKVFLAELWLREDEPAKAQRYLQEVLEATPGAYDLPEEKRAKVLGMRAMVAVKAALR